MTPNNTEGKELEKIAGIIKEFDSHGWQKMKRDEDDDVMIDYESVKAWLTQTLTQAKEQWEQAAREEGRMDQLARETANFDHIITQMKHDAYTECVAVVEKWIGENSRPESLMFYRGKEIIAALKTLTDKP